MNNKPRYWYVELRHKSDVEADIHDVETAIIRCDNGNIDIKLAYMFSHTFVCTYKKEITNAWVPPTTIANIMERIGNKDGN